MLCSLHTHSVFCDGSCTLEEMARAAVRLGLDSFGFSGHAPAPYDRAAMAAEDAEKYLDEIARLKKLFSGAIELYAGMENDALHPFEPSRLDYCIGSVHYIRDDAGEIHCIESTSALFSAAVGTFGSVQAAVDRYCETMEQLLATHRPDIVGHLDIIAKLNGGGRFFDENAPWYRRAEERLALAAAHSGCITEVNTAGLRIAARRAPYPSPHILALLRELNAPVILTADAHRAEDIAAGFDEARVLLRSLGFRTTMILHNGRFSPEEL